MSSKLISELGFGLSALSNLGQLLSTESKAKGRLECLNGIRFLSMTWVLLSHTLSALITVTPLNNLFEAGELFNHFLFRTVLNGYSCVDSFFLLSGLLVAYLSFRELDRRRGKLNWPMFYIHRYIR